MAKRISLEESNARNSESARELALVQRLRLGEKAAIMEAVELHHGFLITMVRPLVGMDTAEDIVQEAWIKAFAAIGRFELRSSLRTWLTQIAMNHARTKRRSQAREQTVDSFGQDPGSPISNRFGPDGRWYRPPEIWHQNSPDSLLTAVDLRACIEEHIVKLPADQQSVLRLREIEMLEMAEIEEILALTAGNIRVLLHRACQRMHTMIDHFQKTGTC